MNTEPTEADVSSRKTTVYEKSLAVLIILVSISLGLAGMGIALAALFNGTWSSNDTRSLAIGFFVLTGGSAFGYRVFISTTFWQRPFGKLTKIGIPLLILIILLLEFITE